MIGEWITIGILVAAVLVALLAANLKVGAPNEVLIFSGRRRRRPDRKVVGYRIVKGGRGFRMPVFESVHRMSLEAVPINLELQGVLSKELIPLDVRAVATVKVAGDEDGLYNAIERFLGLGKQEIGRVAAQTLEGSLRGVLATMSPEEANSDRAGCVQQVRAETAEDFQRLGLVLDTVRVHHIQDTQHYLEAIGRKRNAQVQRDARIAEAEAEAESRQVVAEAARGATIAEAEAQRATMEAQTQLRVKTAEADASGRQAEARAEVAGEIARVQQGCELEQQRVEYNTRKTEADVIVPARAEKEAEELRAQGRAARIVEDGKATAEAVRLMHQEWQDGATRDLFLLQQLPDLTDHITRVVSENLDIDRLTVIDGGRGDGLSSLVAGLTRSVSEVMEQIQDITGLEIREMLHTRRRGARGAVPREHPEPR